MTFPFPDNNYVLFLLPVSTEFLQPLAVIFSHKPVSTLQRQQKCRENNVLQINSQLRPITGIYKCKVILIYKADNRSYSYCTGKRYSFTCIAFLPLTSIYSHAPRPKNRIQQA